MNDRFPALIDGVPTRAPRRVSSERRTKIRKLHNLGSEAKVEATVEDYASVLTQFISNAAPPPALSEK